MICTMDQYEDEICFHLDDEFFFVIFIVTKPIFLKNVFWLVEFIQGGFDSNDRDPRLTLYTKKNQ